MNKRHYEHTLPNIRGSLSNTYSESENQQTIDIYFEDNSEPAQICQLTFDFNNEAEDEDSVVTADSKELPVTIVGH